MKRVVLAVLLTAAAAGCDGRATTWQLAWCSLNPVAVALVPVDVSVRSAAEDRDFSVEIASALERRGLLERFRGSQDWLLVAACAVAYDRALGR